MSDNSPQIPLGTGDLIRDVDRGTAKTQVFLLDVGGQAGPESLVSPAAPLPVQQMDSGLPDSPTPTLRVAAYLQRMQLMLAHAQAQSGAGFVPIEIPSFFGA
jgi:hypothetical protein